MHVMFVVPRKFAAMLAQSAQPSIKQCRGSAGGLAPDSNSHATERSKRGNHRRHRSDDSCAPGKTSDCGCTPPPQCARDAPTRWPTAMAAAGMCASTAGTAIELRPAHRHAVEICVRRCGVRSAPHLHDHERIRLAAAHIRRVERDSSRRSDPQ